MTQLPSVIVRDAPPSMEVDAIFSLRLKIGARGVTYMKLFWNCALLTELRLCGLKSVVACINPKDLGHILVFPSAAAAPICVPNVHPTYAFGLSLSMHKRNCAWTRETAFDSAPGTAFSQCMLDLRLSDGGAYTIEPSTSQSREHCE